VLFFLFVRFQQVEKEGLELKPMVAEFIWIESRMLSRESLAENTLPQGV
jgi:hypothetical protein